MVIIVNIIIIITDGQILEIHFSTMQKCVLYFKIFDPTGIYMSKWTA